MYISKKHTNKQHLKRSLGEKERFGVSIPAKLQGELILNPKLSQLLSLLYVLLRNKKRIDELLN
jgi:hypothetical protein